MIGPDSSEGLELVKLFFLDETQDFVVLSSIAMKSQVLWFYFLYFDEIQHFVVPFFYFDEIQDFVILFAYFDEIQDSVVLFYYFDEIRNFVARFIPRS